MNRKQFLLILQQINNSNKVTIKKNAFSFDFQQINDDIICTFTTSDHNDMLINVTATIKQSQPITFKVQSGNKTIEMTQKDILANYNKEYLAFKQALKEYRQQLFDNKYIKKEEQAAKAAIASNSNVPLITPLNSILNKEKQKNDETNIRVRDTIYNYKYIKDEQLQNIYQVSFSILNKDLDKDDEKSPFNYNVTAILKFLPTNSLFTKFIIHNPKDQENDQELTLIQFREKYQEQFSKLIKSLTIFQKMIQNKREI